MNFWFPFGVSLGLSLLVWLTRSWHGAWSQDPHDGIQKIHDGSAARIGGLAIFLTLVAAFYLWSPQDVRIILKELLLGGMGVFLVGLLEDLTKSVSALFRLVVAFVCAISLMVYSGITIQSFGLGGWEVSVLAFRPAALVITAICIAGMVNALNLIDGLNGLAAGFAAAALAALAVVATGAGDHVFAAVCWTVFAATLGFLVFNWPLGRLFLGDGGAYLLGMILAWLAILLPARNPGLSPWVSFLILLYAATETVFTVLRRAHLKRHPGAPDRLHLHGLIKRRIVRPLLPDLSLNARNSVAGLVTAAFAALPCLVAVMFSQSQRTLILASFIFVAVYLALYRRLSRFRWG